MFTYIEYEITFTHAVTHTYMNHSQGKISSRALGSDEKWLLELKRGNHYQHKYMIIYMLSSHKSREANQRTHLPLAIFLEYFTPLQHHGRRHQLICTKLQSLASGVLKISYWKYLFAIFYGCIKGVPFAPNWIEIGSWF